MKNLIFFRRLGRVSVFGSIAGLAAGLTALFYLMTPPSAETASAPAAPSSTASAKVTLGGGCFWCVEAVYERVKGVKSVVSGYAGGQAPNPTYKQVCSGTTGHAEVVQIEYDPSQISFEELLSIFWKAHDPTTKDQQGADVGTQYRSVILFENEEQKAVAEKSIKEAAAKFRDPIVTEVAPLEKFYPAEDYHQDYFRKNPSAGYCLVVIEPKLRKLEKQNVFED